MRKILCLAVAWGVLLTVPAVASTMKSIGKELVNVRSQPNLQSEVVFQAYLGYPIQIEKQKKDWVYVTDWRNNTGWVYEPLISDTQTAVVVAENANIRKGPSLKRPIVMHATKGEIYKVFGEKGNWVRVGYYLENEVIGWIREDLVWGN